MQSRLTNRCGVAVALTATLAAFSTPANAIEEFVVTARKIQERLVDVPLAITALTSQDIENKGIRNLDDVAANTPGLTFSNLQGAFLPSPVIRGMAPINVNGENNVGIFIDGVFVSGREGLNFSQLDVERIEIIKGPQAALYGRNTFSGAINYVTAKPTDVFQGKTEITVGTDNRFLAAASASGPLIEGTLKGRIAASIDTYDGAYDNSYSGIGQGADIGGYEYRTGQASLLWTPNDIFEGELSLYVSRDQVDTPPQLPVAANCEDRHDVDPSKSSRLQNFCGTFQSIDRDSISVIPQAVGEDRKLNRAQLRLNWDTDIGTITSQSGYSALKHSGYIDGSRGEGENVIFSYLGTQVAMAPPFNTYQLGQLQTGLLQIQPQTTVEEVSEELRFESPADRDFRYSTGLYAFRTKMRGGDRGVIATKPLPADFTSFCLACAFVGSGYTDFAPGGGDATFLPWFTNPPLGDTVPDKINHSEDKAYAVFASAEWDFIENWTGRIEGRYTRTKKDFDNTATGASGDDSWNTTDWRATLDYKPADNITVYGSIAHAEKSGGFDTKTVNFQSAPTVDVTIPGAFDPEKNTTYELGLKSEFLDRRLRSDFAVYYIDWTDIVIPQTVESINGQPLQLPVAFQVNGGDATIKGAEFSIDAVVTDNLSANIGVSYVDAEYGDARVDSFTLFPSFAPDGQIKGNTILRSSEWQGTAGAGYQAPLMNDIDWYLRGDAAYRGKQYADPTNQSVIPDSTTVNAHLGLTKDTWSIEIYALNLFDNDEPVDAYRDVYFTNTTPDGVTSGGRFFPWRYTVTYPRRVQYGLTWRMKF